MDLVLALKAINGMSKEPLHSKNYTGTSSVFPKCLKPLATLRNFHYFFAACNTIDDPSWKSHILWSIWQCSPEFHPSSHPSVFIHTLHVGVTMDFIRGHHLWLLGLKPSEPFPWVRSPPRLCCRWPQQISSPSFYRPTDHPQLASPGTPQTQQVPSSAFLLGFP